MGKKNFYAIYSVGENAKGESVGFDDLGDGNMGIYIYENSVEDILDKDGKTKIENGDIVCFLRTKKQEIYIFEFNKNEIRGTEEPNSKYLVVKKSDIQEQKFSGISIGDFKNLYFLKLDTLKSWVRSPLSTKRNIIKFENGKDIVKEFVDSEKLKKVFENISNYTRQYIIGNYGKLEDEKNVYLNYKNGVFGQEYSIFNKVPGIKTEITNKNIKQIINEITNLHSLKICNDLVNLNQYIVDSYSGYYDLTRLANDIEENRKTKIEILAQILEGNDEGVDLGYIYDEVQEKYNYIADSKEWKAALRGTLYRELDTLFKKTDSGKYKLNNLNPEEDKKHQMFNEDSLDQRNDLQCKRLGDSKDKLDKKMKEEMKRVDNLIEQSKKLEKDEAENQIELKNLLSDIKNIKANSTVWGNKIEEQEDVKRKESDFQKEMMEKIMQEQEDVKRKESDFQKEMKEKIQEKEKEYHIEKQKEGIKKFISNKNSTLKGKRKFSIFCFIFGIILVLSINCFLLLYGTYSKIEINNFLQEFLSKGIYIFIIEFLILYISYFYFSLSNKYLQIIEIYDSYSLLSEIEEWSSIQINDKEFRKENIRKLFGIQNVVKESFEKNNDKMPMMELVDSLGKVKNITK